jgi:hypothetical protein
MPSAQTFQLLGQIAAALFAINVAIQAAAAMMPRVRWLQVVAHWSGAFANSIPRTLTPPPLPVIGQPVTPIKTGGFAKLGLLPFTIALCLALSCATTPLGTALINCGEADLSTSATQLGPSVLSLLSGGAVDWAAQLSSLVVTQGVAVVCAVQAIVQSIQGKLAVGELAPADQIALLRAQAFLGAYGATVSGAEIHIATHPLLKQ